MLFGLIVFGAIVLVVFLLAATYNGLVTGTERAARAWNELDALLRQRHDEIPKLIELCEQHLKHERAVFERVLAARTEVFGARQTRAADALSRAEITLRAELAALIALASTNAELGASPAFGMLRQRNSTLDAEIVERRALYNAAAARYNAAIARLPGNVVALLGGFRPLASLDAEAGSDA
jgi:LemA protein